MNEIQLTEIKQIEIEINFYKGQAVQSIFEIGERLNRAKGLVDHGEWEEWLENKIDFSKPQAQRFMQVAREFPNAVSLRGLNQSKVFALVALPAEERDSFIEENPVEDMTTRELRQAIKDKKELEQKIEELENQKPRVIEVPVEIIPEDYEALKNQTSLLNRLLEDLQRQVKNKDHELEKAKREKESLESKAKLNEKDANKYNKLTEDIENLTREKDDIGRQIKAKTELSGLVVRIEHMLKNELAPVKYSRAINEVSTDIIITTNLRDIVNRVQDWCNEMYKYLPMENRSQIIEMEAMENEY